MSQDIKLTDEQKVRAFEQRVSLHTYTEILAEGIAIGRAAASEVTRSTMAAKMVRELIVAAVLADRQREAVVMGRTTHWYACPHCHQPIDPPRTED